jgi:hypothetical protein
MYAIASVGAPAADRVRASVTMTMTMMIITTIRGGNG